MSTFSTNLALELIGNGEQAGNWGQTTNTNLGTLVEQAISGYTTQAISDVADTTLTMTQGASATARNMYIELTGTLTGARNLIVPSNRKLYFIFNNTTGGFAVTVKVSGQTGVSVANLVKTILVSNGTDIVLATTPPTAGVTSVSGTGTVNGLTLTGTVTSTGNLTLGGSLSGTASGLTVGSATNATNATFATSAGSVSGIVAVGNGGTGSSSLAGAGIVTISGTNNYTGPNTFTNISNFTNVTNFTAPTNFTTYAGGASFGSATPNATYAAFIKANPSGTGGLATQNQSTYPGYTCLTDNTGVPLINFFSGTLSSSTFVGNITTNGSQTAYNISSDYRLKENIAPLVGAVARVKLLKPCNYTWKQNPDFGTLEGFIAHEMAEVVPNGVHGEKDAVDPDGKPIYQGVDHSFLVPMLTAALQEALTRIEALEAKVG
jgi:hypothetical protein